MADKAYKPTKDFTADPSKGYKAATDFSFDGKNYTEGQDVSIDNEAALVKLLQRGQISAGKGKATEDIDKEQRAKEAKASEEATKKINQADYDREKAYIDKGSKPSVKLTTDDQTGGIKEKDEKSGPNKPK